MATLLRDYPLLSSAASSRANVHGDMDSASSASDVIVHSSYGCPFLEILTMAAGSAVLKHFQSLVSVNMVNFINQKFPPFYFESVFDMFGRGDSSWHRLVPWEATDGLLAILRGLFEILDKARTCYQVREHSVISMHYLRLLKAFLDNFDEALFVHGDSTSEIEHTDTCESSMRDSIDSSQVLDDDAFFEAPSDSLNESKDDRKRTPRYTVISPKNDIKPKPFSRKAFVASRSERIKAESELSEDRDYFEDDETVMTFGTYTSRMDSASVFPVISENESLINGDRDDLQELKSSTFEIQGEPEVGWGCGSGIPGQTTRRRSPEQIKNSTPFSFAARRAEDMASRVNSMAQMIIAPCIAPTMDEMFVGNVKKSPRSPKMRGASQTIVLNVRREANAIVVIYVFN